MSSVIAQLSKDMQERVERNPHLREEDVLVISQAERLKFPNDFRLHSSAGKGISPPAAPIVPPHPPRPHLISADTLTDASLTDFVMLSGGHGRLSQTYMCKILPGESRVVLKLFQQEYMPYPEDEWGYETATLQDIYKDWPLAETLYSTEALAFERLCGYQGTRLPYSYGFYRMKLPSGDVTVGHLMEYIDYPMPCELANAGSIDWIEFVSCVLLIKLYTANIKQFIDCLLDFKKCIVEHSDLAARNIRAFRTSDQAAWNFILLDWASATFKWDADFGFKDWDIMSVLAKDLRQSAVCGSAGDPARWLWEEGRHKRGLLLNTSRHPGYIIPG